MKKLLTYLLSALMVLGLLAPALAQAQVPDSGVVDKQLTDQSRTATAQAQTTLNAGGTITPTTAPQNQPNSGGAGQDDLGCSFSNATGQGSVSAGMGLAICTSHLVYYVFVGLGSWFANIAAYVFDYAVYISLSSAAYALDFIAIGWGVVRDVANMAFLFILLYIGIKTLLNAETAGTIRLLVGVIVMALLVNFSFVLTRIVIDGGNIVAVQFYNTIAAGSPPIGQAAPGATSALNSNTNGGVPTRDITATIMNALNPQALVGSTGTGGTFKNFVSDTSNSAMYYLIVSSVVFILTGLTLFMLAATFVFVAVKFIIRVVGLWFVIIAAPAAFVAAIFRGKEGGNNLFKQWLGYLINFSFYPAIFLFMFYIQIRFMLELKNDQLFNNLLNATGSAGQSWTAIVQAAANVGVRLGFIMATMYLSLKVADWTAGELSQASHWLHDKASSGLVRTARWGRLGVAGLGYGAAAVRTVTQPMSNAATRSGVNSTLWRGLNRIVGGENAARPRSQTLGGAADTFGLTSRSRAAGGLVRAAKEEAAAQTQAAAQQPVPAQPAAIAQPGARRIPLPAGQPRSQRDFLDVQSAQPASIPQPGERRIPLPAGPPRTPAQVAAAANPASRPAPTPISNASLDKISDEMRKMREAAQAARTQQPIVIKTPGPGVIQQSLKPTSVHVDSSLTEDDLNKMAIKLAHKLGPRLASSLPSDHGPGGPDPAPAAPAQTRPAPQTSTDVLGSEGMKA